MAGWSVSWGDNEFLLNNLLEVTKRSVEIAIKQDETAALDYIATECSHD